MQVKSILLCIVFASAFSACSARHEPELATRNASDAPFALVELQDQVVSLKTMTKGILRKSATRSAGQGMMDRNIEQTKAAIDNIQMSLPGLLASQDITLAELASKMAKGETTEATYAAQADAIRTHRGELAHALSVSAAQVQSALEYVMIAKSRGAVGLDGYQMSLDNLARDITAAYGSIDLLG